MQKVVGILSLISKNKAEITVHAREVHEAKQNSKQS